MLVNYIKNWWCVDNEEGCLKLQQDIDPRESWVEHWQIKCNPVMCKVLLFGNRDGTYTVNCGTEEC